VQYDIRQEQLVQAPLAPPLIRHLAIVYPKELIF
jgi:hypothetical protein